MNLATAQKHLDHWLKADLMVSQNQTFQAGNQSFTRADADTIRQRINYYQGLVNKLSKRSAKATRPAW